MSESGLHGQPDDAMVDLLVKQVTEGLSPAEQRELDAMDTGIVSRERRGFERAAAALTLVGTKLEEPPPELQALLLRRGVEILAADKVVQLKVPPPADEPLRGDDSRGGTPERSGTRAVSGARDAGSTGARNGTWGWLAAAACLVLAVFGWMRSPQPAAPVETVQLSPPGPPAFVPSAEPPAPPQPPTPAEARAEMLARAETVKVTLGATKDPAGVGVTGDAVWDPVSQKGFLHFVGLTANDPSVRQYQIWVFDGKRDKRYPVDGGVFDVPADAAEVVIPIHASLAIGQAKAFAVTVEKAGGVVVSGLGHVVALGAAG